MKRSISFVLALCMLLSLAGALSVPAAAYGISDWVPASSVPADAQIVARKWTYTRTTYLDSRNQSESGYTLIGSEWVQSGSGSAPYASFPSTFNTSHSLYQNINKSNPYANSETATDKRVVSTSRTAYIYWHWAYNAAYANRTDRWISDRKQNAGSSRGLPDYAYTYFFAFQSTANAPQISGFTYTWTSNGKYDSNAVTYNCSSCLPAGADTSPKSGLNNPRFLRFDIYTSYYTDYYKLFHHQKTEYLESDQELSESSSGNVVISNVQELVKYINTFSVSFDANGGTNAPEAQTKSFGVPLTLTSAVPERPGYAFLGWSVSPSALDGTYQPGELFSSDQDTTLYAVWQSLTEYTITYDAKTNGGAALETPKRSYFEGQKADLTVAATKSGWSFVGWNTDKNAHAGLSELTVTANVTIYAIYSRTVHPSCYIGNNQLLQTLEATYYNKESGASVSLPAIPAFSGWTVVGWTRGGTDYAAGAAVTVSGDVRFDAKYSKALTLSYNLNGGQGSVSAQSVTLYHLADGSYEEAQPVLAAAVSRLGYSFDKWAMNSPEGAKYAPGDTVFIQADTVMYATWTELPPLAAPEIKVSNAANGKTVRITGPEGAALHYTTDGSSPTAASPVYTKAVTLSKKGDYTVKAIALREGYADSPVATVSVSVGQAPKPEADRPAGYLRQGTAIVLSAASRTVHYTTDGSAPNAKSPAYTEPIVMEGDMTLRAVTSVSGSALSEEAVYVYQLTPLYTAETWGWSFVNAASSFGYRSTAPAFLNYCIPYSSVSLIFGDTVKAKSVYKSISSYTWSGNCCGMASTSSLLWSVENELGPSAFGQGTVAALGVNDTAAALDSITVRTFIEALQVSQCSVQFDRELSRNKLTNTKLAEGETLDALVAQIRADLEANRNDLIAVGMRGVGGHALLAYDLREDAAGLRLYIYDCNHPKDDNRYIALTRDGSGAITGWSYDMGGYGVWGTGSVSECYLSYVPYTTISYIWEHRGNLSEDYVALTVNAENVAIYTLTGDYVGVFQNGEFVTERDDVYEVPNLKLTPDADYTVYVPEDFYVVTKPGGGELEASMVGDRLGASVTTTAQEVCFGMDQALNLNDISIINSGTGTSYTISLDSSYYDTQQQAVFNNITISGTGTGSGDGIHLSTDPSGMLNLSNAVVNSYIVNGVEQIVYTISATSGAGGSISPAGDTKVPANTDATYVFLPDSGYRVKAVYVDGNNLGAAESFTFPSVGRDHSIHVVFEEGGKLTGVSVSGKTVSVSLKGAAGAELAVAVYDAAHRLVEVRTLAVQASQNSASVTLSSPPPAGGTVRAFLYDAASGAPLCDALSP